MCSSLRNGLLPFLTKMVQYTMPKVAILLLCIVQEAIKCLQCDAHCIDHVFANAHLLCLPQKGPKRQRCQDARSYAPYSYIFQAPSPVP